MSFILDALRKSEHERQRQAGPGIAELPVVRAASHMPIALLVLGVLLAINAVVVIVLLLRQGAPVATGDFAPPARVEEQPAPAPTDAPGRAAEPPPPRASAVPAPEPAREVRPLSGEAGVPAALAESAAPPPAPDPSLLPALPALPMTPPSQRSGAVSRTGEYVPPINTLSPQATAGLPVLNLDLHIYANDPAQRAAFINGRRYREGESLPEGVVVESITQDGAVLRHRGQRFLLPRQ